MLLKYIYKLFLIYLNIIKFLFYNQISLLILYFIILKYLMQDRNVQDFFEKVEDITGWWVALSFTVNKFLIDFILNLSLLTKYFFI